ncbi:PQQ-dependent sugar dehydrogenase [Deinococcus alpinitundrae]|uniref:PQQ-dependent sugar dehydrogenase n=1 Tax=Deinococcus alpinitundrae TaxID=468913 RepID=UPI001379A278|nr:PQQ-dependent sugar dehydrogenase [Deinococcus alpinitundrae]
MTVSPLNPARLGLLFALSLALGACAYVRGPNTAAPELGLTLPAGFHAEVYASGFKKPRLMATSANGDVFVSDLDAGQVDVLLDRNGDGTLDAKQVFASGLNEPHGLAFHKGFLYVADTDAVVRFPYAAGDTAASAAPEKLVDLPVKGKHYSRTVVFGPDDKMYVAAGSDCNACEETDPKRAAVWVYDENGQQGRPYATGLRNAVGLAWQGGTFYASANGRDLLGNDTPPESFFKLQDGANYGWPYCYPLAAGAKQTWDQEFGKKDQAYCDAAQPSFATTTAHAAPLGIAFYTPAQGAARAFPAKYDGLMFAALHGSWNRLPQSGYKVITVNPQTGETQDFLSGFHSGLSTSGRPVDVHAAPDGSLLLTDDGNGLIYRISYSQ